MRIILFTFLLAAIPAAACVNGGYTPVVVAGQSPAEFLREQMETLPSGDFAIPSGDRMNRPVLEADPAAAGYDALHDIYTGDYGAAIEKLLDVEATHPGNYSTAANLGTAYELAGDNLNALHWISEDIKRNKDAHQGTEWLHKKILEAKLPWKATPTTSRRVTSCLSPIAWPEVLPVKLLLSTMVVTSRLTV